MTVAPGLSVAFAAAPLDDNPTFTRLDNLASSGLSIQRISIRRGRPDEWSKTGTGTMTVTGVDQAGILDPTNAGSPHAGSIDPTKQVAYALQHPISTTWYYLYFGRVKGWGYDMTGLDRTAKYPQLTIDCVDALDQIAAAEVIPDTAGNSVPSESTGDVYYSDAASNDDRILAALADSALSAGGATYPAGQLDVFTGNTKVKGAVYAGQTPLLQVIDDACDADYPGATNRFVSRDGKFTFRGRLSRFDPTNPTYNVSSWNLGDATAFAGDNTIVVISDLTFSRDDTNLINAALCTPKDIRDADIAGQLSTDPTSIGAYCARSVSFADLLTDGRADGSTGDLDETYDFTQSIVANYKDPQNRITSIVLRPQPPNSKYGTTDFWNFMCQVELSDLVHVTTTHPGGGGFNDDFFVESITYDIAPMTSTYPEVTLTLEVSPRAHYTSGPFAP